MRENADQNNSEDGLFLRSFGDLLDKDKSVSIHLQNIQKLGIEIFKVLKGENAQIVNEVFFQAWDLLWASTKIISTYPFY